MSKTHPTHFQQSDDMPWKKKVHKINGREYYYINGKYVPVYPNKPVKLARTTSNIIATPTGGR